MVKISCRDCQINHLTIFYDCKENLRANQGDIPSEKVVFQSVGIVLTWSGKDYFILIFKTLKTLAAISIQLAFLL